ncbi:MAG TPA: diguanylate cyclase [Clostridiales bacterium UBA8960]|nr:diguanylate cyclase [Clostridiales bacterium UBA8960]
MNAPVAYFVIDDENTILNFNHRAVELFKTIKKNMLLTPLISRESQDDFYFHMKELKETSNTVINYIDFIVDDKSRHMKLISTPGLSDDQHTYHLSLIDQTVEKEYEMRINFLSFHDQLTGLYNRRYFIEEAERLDKEEHLPLGFIMADLNGLKLMNDAFGHQSGDELLIMTSQMLKVRCGKKGVVARLGGDEFAVLLPNIDEDDLKLMIRDLESDTKNLSLNDLELSVALGYSIKTHISQSFEALMKTAEDSMYHKKLYMSKNQHQEIIKFIINTLNEKYPNEEEHSERVTEYLVKFGKVYGLEEVELLLLKTAGLLHDIGKIALDHSILNLNRSLTDKERKEVQKHPEIGYRILKGGQIFTEVLDIVLTHHERFDGNGYPRGLRGDEIPIEARMLTICDAYDAMISERPYRLKLSKETAILELRSNANSQFDSNLVELFINKVI